MLTRQNYKSLLLLYTARVEQGLVLFQPASMV